MTGLTRWFLVRVSERLRFHPGPGLPRWNQGHGMVTDGVCKWRLFGSEDLHERSSASWVGRLARARLWQSCGALQRTSASLWELLSPMGECANTAAMHSLQSRYHLAMVLETKAKLHLWLETAQTTTASEHSSAHRNCPSPQFEKPDCPGLAATRNIDR